MPVTISKPTEGSIPRNIQTKEWGLDVQITETQYKYGFRARVKIEGVKLTRKQEELLADALMIWKYGLVPCGEKESNV